MLFFLQAGVTAAVLAVTSLVGWWQAANQGGVPFPFLTLSSRQNAWQPLDHSGVGHAKHRLTLHESGNASSDLPSILMRGSNNEPQASIPFYHTNNISAPVINGANISDADAANDTFGSAQYQNPFAQNYNSWGNVGAERNEGAASYREFVLDKLASLNSVLDYLFSFVEDRPESALEMLQFTVVGIFIVGLVFFMGGTCYWALRLLDFRGQNAPTAPNLHYNNTEVAIRASEDDANDALSMVLDIVKSVPGSMASPDADSTPVETPTMEILAYMTEVVQFHYDLVEENTDTKIKRVIKQHNDHAQNFDSKLEVVATESKTDAQNLGSKLDGVAKESKDTVTKVKSLNAKCDSKAAASVVSELGKKLDKLAANVRTVAQAEVETTIKRSEFVSTKSLNQLKTDVFSNKNSISKIVKDVEELKNIYGKESAENRKKNESLMRSLEDEKKAQVTTLTNEVKELRDALASKSDVEPNEHLKEEMAQLKETYKADLAELRAMLETAKQGMEKQQGDLDSIKKELDSKVGDDSTELVEQRKTLANINKILKLKADSQDLATIKNRLPGLVNNRQLEDVTSQVHAVASRIDSTDRTIKDVRGRVESISEMKKTVDQMHVSLNSKAEASEVATLTDLVANKVDEKAFTNFKTQTEGQIPTFSTKQFNDLKKAVEDGKKSINDVNTTVNNAVTSSRSAITNLQQQLQNKAEVNRVIDLHNATVNTMTDLHEGVVNDLHTLDNAIKVVGSRLNGLDQVRAMLEGLGVKHVKDVIYWFQRQDLTIQTLARKVDDRSFKELADKVDATAEKSLVKYIQETMEGNVADITEEYKHNRAMTTSTQPEGRLIEGAPIDLDSALEKMSIDPIPTSNPSDEAVKDKATATASASLPAAPTNGQTPEAKPDAVSQQTQNVVTASTAPAPSLPAAPINGQTPQAKPDAVSQPTQNVVDASTAPAPSPNTVSQLHDQKTSNLHAPAVQKADPELAARRIKPLKASRFATPERQPLTDKTSTASASNTRNASAFKPPSFSFDFQPQGGIVYPPPGENESKSFSFDFPATSRNESKSFEPPSSGFDFQPRGGIAHPATNENGSDSATIDLTQQSAPSVQTLPASNKSEWAQAPIFTSSSLPTTPSAQTFPASNKSEWAQAPAFTPSSSTTTASNKSHWAQAPAFTPSSSTTTASNKSEWAQAPAFTPSSSTTTPSATFGTSQWSDEAAFVPSKPKLGEFTEEQISLQNPALTLEEKMGTSYPIPALYSREGADSLEPVIGISAFMSQPNQEPEPAAQESLAPRPTSSRADDDQDFNPPQAPRARNHGYGNGPGPHGGHRKVTEGRRAHNKERKFRNETKKALDKFGVTPEQQGKVEKLRHPVTFGFAKGSGWEWLNPIVFNGARWDLVSPPPGWVMPVPTNNAGYNQQ